MTTDRPQHETSQISRTGFARAIAAALILSLVCSNAAFADWDDKSGNLPGISSTKSVVVAAGIGVGAAVAFLLMKRRANKSIEEGALHAPVRLEFTSAETRKTVPLANRGSDILSVSEIGFDGKGYASAMATPVSIPPGGSIELSIDRDTNAKKKAKLRLTALTPKGKSINRVVEIRISE